jgi:hypothetical protein
MFYNFADNWFVRLTYSQRAKIEQSLLTNLPPFLPIPHVGIGGVCSNSAIKNREQIPDSLFHHFRHFHQYPRFEGEL